MQHIETEIKLRWSHSPQKARALLAAHGYHPQGPREHELDILFDRPPAELQSQKKVLRLRRITIEGQMPRAVVTYKGAPQDGPHKVREEIEFSATDPEAVELVLARLGYQATFRYEKLRETFRNPGERGLITLDETPIGVFMELEGPADWIDRVARTIGFSAADYITASYASLYRDFRASRPQAPPNMVFQRE